MTDKEIIKRDKRRALVFRAAMELVDQVYGEAVEAANKGEGPVGRVDSLYELLDAMKRYEGDMYCREVYFDGYEQPGEDWDY